RSIAAGSCMPNSGAAISAMTLARYDGDGILDPTFGSGGVVTTPIGAQYSAVLAVALQPNGGILAAGSADQEMALARYQPDGSLDRSFGSNGASTLRTGGLQSAWAVALQAEE